ncbi:MAG: Phosphoadenosine phosphosulfate reductase [Elusimicrobia bacterium]|nr:Phosphoadenosine phosphosulfate reductase [Elusimicrobiota bacterium]
MNIQDLNKKFESASPQEILTWAIKTYAPRVGLSSSFGGQSAALIHMATQIEPSIPILFLDTGFLFKETHEFVEELRNKFHLNLKVFRASPEQMAVTKKNLDARTDSSGICCDATKVDLMQKSLAGLDCWIAGLRRSQGETRKNIGIVEEYRSGLVKVHPLANWSGKQIYSYMKEHQLPFHPLWEKGYTSIGCEPCTSLPAAGEGERSGRWAGLSKKECGIHTFLERKS